MLLEKLMMAFVHKALDSTEVNSWKLYNIVNDNKMSQLNFKFRTAIRFLKTKNHGARPLQVEPFN